MRKARDVLVRFSNFLRGAGIFQAKQKPFPLSAITRQAGRPAAFFC